MDRDTSDDFEIIMRENQSHEDFQIVQNFWDLKARLCDSGKSIENHRERFKVFLKLLGECSSQFVAVQWDSNFTIKRYDSRRILSLIRIFSRNLFFPICRKLSQPSEILPLVARAVQQCVLSGTSSIIVSNQSLLIELQSACCNVDFAKVSYRLVFFIFEMDNL